MLNVARARGKAAEEWNRQFCPSPVKINSLWSRTSTPHAPSRHVTRRDNITVTSLSRTSNPWVSRYSVMVELVWGCSGKGACFVRSFVI